MQVENVKKKERKELYFTVTFVKAALYNFWGGSTSNRKHRKQLGSKCQKEHKRFATNNKHEVT